MISIELSPDEVIFLAELLASVGFNGLTSQAEARRVLALVDSMQAKLAEARQALTVPDTRQARLTGTPVVVELEVKGNALGFG